MSKLEELLTMPIEEMTLEQMTATLDAMDNNLIQETKAKAKKTRKNKERITKTSSKSLSFVDLVAKIQLRDGCAFEEARDRAISEFNPKR